MYMLRSTWKRSASSRLNMVMAPMDMWSRSMTAFLLQARVRDDLSVLAGGEQRSLCTKCIDCRPQHAASRIASLPHAGAAGSCPRVLAGVVINCYSGGAEAINKDGNMPQLRFNDDGQWHDFALEGGSEGRAVVPLS